MPSDNLSKAVKDAGPWLLGFLVIVLGITALRRNMKGPPRTLLSWLGVVAAVIVLGIAAGKIGFYMPQVASDSPHQRVVDVMKAALAAAALGCVFYEIRRIGERRPIAERWKKFVG